MTIPCKDCITLAICRSKVRKTGPIYEEWNGLVNKCELLRKYMTPNGKYDGRQSVIAYSFLKGYDEIY